MVIGLRTVKYKMKDDNPLFEPTPTPNLNSCTCRIVMPRSSVTKRRDAKQEALEARLGEEMVEIILRDEGTLMQVVWEICGTAAAEHNHIRLSISLVKSVRISLAMKSLSLAISFVQEIASAAVDLFVDYWTAVFDDKDRQLTTSIQPRELCAYVGDLAAAGYISYRQFKFVVLVLLRGFRKTSEVDCLMCLFKHATTGCRFIKEDAFLTGCLADLRTRCAQCIGPKGIISEAESELTHHICDMLLRKDCIVCPRSGHSSSLAAVPLSKFDKVSSLATIAWPATAQPSKRSKKASQNYPHCLVPFRRNMGQFSWGTSPPPEELPSPDLF
ncbi:hypothetical protein BDZ97DRAFT_1923344 [Flammula alnicola]|nr:hypothetical protein BDZ97DRAFT_1923344 [Flammula alnicola]